MNRRIEGREDGMMGREEEGWGVSLSGSLDPGTSHLKVGSGYLLSWKW